MNRKQKEAIFVAAGFGVIAGLRSLSAPQLLGRGLSRRRRRRGRLGRMLGSRAAVWPLRVAALGELVVDKLPGVPARTDPLPLLGRAATGALCGLAVAGELGVDALAPAAAGAGAAVAAAFAAYHLRRGADRALPDAVVGLAEDGLVRAVGSRFADAAV
ncbi:MAG: DUF4126 domain-containing protein [Gemmatimonadetes bacterium]|nr:DUF4126 domain-containing protein [Gemmatimonadota bacterium]